MGQVPESKRQSTGPSPQVAIIGDGRLARHLGHYFDLKDISFESWNRKEDRDLHEVLKSISTVCLCITDGAIESFIETNSAVLQGKTLIHFSGALDSKKAIGVHPLMTFPKSQMFDLDVYESIHFVVDETFISWEATIPGLKNPVHRIRNDKKAYYHALCVLAGNFSFLLWDKLFSEFESKLAIPRRAAFPYMAQVFSSILEDSRANLTGPLVRNDVETVDRNLSALSGDEYQEVYQSFVNAFNKERISSQ